MATILKHGKTIASLFAVMATLVIASPQRARAAAWQIETIDQSGPGKYTSMKIDKYGNAHVAYVVDDGAKYPLRYAFWDHTTKLWFGMTIATGASFSSLTLDSEQRPHISYADFGTMSGAKLHYAHWDGASWKSEAIPLNSEIVAYYTSIALDSNDHPSISFYEYRGPRGSGISIRLRIVKWNGQIWSVQTIDQQEGSGKFNCIANDAAGRLHIAYANVSAETASMRYSLWDGQSMSSELVEGFEEAKGYVGYSACMALDQSGNPHIAYTDTTKSRLKYATRKDGKWQKQVVDNLSGFGYPDRNSIALDSQGQPYIGYFDSGRGVLKVAHLEKDRWMLEIVDGGSTGFTSSMQIDGGVVWITYADEGQGSLKVARRELSVSEAADSSPAITDPEPAAKVAQTGQ